MSDRCRACGQELPPAKRGRRCSLCDLPIKLHHKWFFVGGRAQHRVCEEPEAFEAGQVTVEQLSIGGAS